VSDIDFQVFGETYPQIFFYIL